MKTIESKPCAALRADPISLLASPMPPHVHMKRLIRHALPLLLLLLGLLSTAHAISLWPYPPTKPPGTTVRKDRAIVSISPGYDNTNVYIAVGATGGRSLPETVTVNYRVRSRYAGKGPVQYFSQDFTLIARPNFLLPNGYWQHFPPLDATAARYVSANNMLLTGRVVTLLPGNYNMMGNEYFTIGTNPGPIAGTNTTHDGLGTQSNLATKSKDDLNADGDADIIWRNDNGQVVYWMLEGGVYQSGGNVNPSPTGWDWKIVDVADLNGDGHADIIWRNDSGLVHCWIMRDGIRQSGYDVYGAPIGWDWNIVDVEDLNGDNHADIIWRQNSGQVVYWLLRDGIYQTGGNVSPSPVGWDWKIVDVEDLNGDCDADILWRNDSGLVHRWILKGGIQQDGLNVWDYPVGSDWKLVDVADFNGDGHADILWRHDSGQVHCWGLYHGIRQGGFNVLGPVGWDWHIVGVKSLNGDSHADILWRHDSGLLVNWILSDGIYQSGAKVFDSPIGWDWKTVRAK